MASSVVANLLKLRETAADTSASSRDRWCNDPLVTKRGDSYVPNYRVFAYLNFSFVIFLLGRMLPKERVEEDEC
jgi:hypothetical protein